MDGLLYNYKKSTLRKEFLRKKFIFFFRRYPHYVVFFDHSDYFSSIKANSIDYELGRVRALNTVFLDTNGNLMSLSN